MTRRRWVAILVGGVILLAATAAFWPRGAAPVAVNLQPVPRRDLLCATATASGEIVATRYADIGSNVMGKVVALPVAEGDTVRKGQVLARIDPVQAETQAAGAAAQVSVLEADERGAREQAKAAASALDVAKARAREATAAFDRARALGRQGIFAQAELDSAQAAADAARAQVASAEAEQLRMQQAIAAAGRRITAAASERTRTRDVLSKTEITSPIDGTVTRLNVRAGEMVVVGIQNQPGTTLMTVSDLGSINAEVKVAEADVLRLRVGQPASVTLDALPGRSFAGTLIEIGASALPQLNTAAAAREFRAVIRLSDPDPGLRPGLTCDAEITTAEKRGVLAVPLQAVVLRTGADGAERRGVFVVEDKRAKFVPVTTGIIGGLDIEVSGIGERTEVVVGPFQALRDLADGARVRVQGARK